MISGHPIFTGFRKLTGFNGTPGIGVLQIVMILSSENN